MKLRQEIDRASVEFKGDEVLRSNLVATNDATSRTGKLAGDLWQAAARLKELVEDRDSYPALNSATLVEIKRLIRPVAKKAMLPKER